MFKSILASAIVWLVLLALAGLGMLIYGVHCIAGEGWAFVASGVALLALATFIRQGVAHA